MCNTFKVHFCNESLQIIYDCKRFPILNSHFNPCPILEAQPDYIEWIINLYLDNADTDEHMLESEAFLEAMGNMISIQCD